MWVLMEAGVVFEDSHMPLASPADPERLAYSVFCILALLLGRYCGKSIVCWGACYPSWLFCTFLFTPCPAATWPRCQGSVHQVLSQDCCLRIGTFKPVSHALPLCYASIMLRYTLVK